VFIVIRRNEGARRREGSKRDLLDAERPTGTLERSGAEHTMRINQRGQVTIPKQIRVAAGLLPHSDVHIVFDGEAVYLVPAKGRGLRTVRAHGGDVCMSTDEIMALTRPE
jgi:bifunctional DNA-binding transcriptional regulator/antitoxin component of YhaV-PrlF toxin-antitoxin module